MTKGNCRHILDGLHIKHLGNGKKEIKDMLEKVKEIVADGLGVDAAELTAETTFAELGADSLDLMDMVMSFEDEFKIEIDTESMQDLTTIGKVVTYIEGLQK